MFEKQQMVKLMFRNQTFDLMIQDASNSIW